MRISMKVLGIVFLLSTSAFAQEVPQTTDITWLAKRSPRIALLGGHSVTLNQRSLEGNRVFFTDFMPHANWAHPALIEVVDSRSKVLESIPVRLPPLALQSLEKLSVPAMNIDDFGGKYKVSHPDQYFAILINGAANPRHYNDYVFLYRVLTRVYGYLPQNIYIADSNFLGSAPDLDQDGRADITYPSTIAGVKKITADVQALLKPTDHVVVFTNDHGNQLDGESTLVLADGEMKASEFALLILSFPTDQVLSIHEPCFSGGLVRPTVGTQRVVMAAATNDEYSWASSHDNYAFDEFIYAVIAGFAMQTHTGAKLASDFNQDGKVSAQEAFAYATAADQMSESPVMESGSEGHTGSGAASRIGLGF